jgi:hypothetical protein
MTGAPPLERSQGRYAVFHAGRECGEERWRIEASPDGLTATGEQELVAPFPFPNRQEFRVTLSPEWRVTGIEILWTVGGRRVTARHHAEGGRWHARIDHAGHVKEQEGDYPAYCEVEYTTHLFNLFILARRDFQIGGEHEFPVLRIGPPHMAVTPERMLYRCVEAGRFASPLGPVPAKRYVVSLPARDQADSYTFWADERGLVLESCEGLDPTRPWMRLMEWGAT